MCVFVLSFGCVCVCVAYILYMHTICSMTLYPGVCVTEVRRRPGRNVNWHIQSFLYISKWHMIILLLYIFNALVLKCEI